MSGFPNDQLVLIGDHHESIPVLLITDPDLSSNDKILWQVLRTSIQRTPGQIAMPSYDDIAAIMGITRKTIIASMSSLRITRWLSVQHQFDETGRQTRNIYAIHSRPASISDAVALDSKYPDLLQKCAGEEQGRVRHLAGQALHDMGSRQPLLPSRLLADQDEYDAALKAHGQVTQNTQKSESRRKTPIFGRTPIRFSLESVPSKPLESGVGPSEATLDIGQIPAKNPKNRVGPTGATPNIGQISGKNCQKQAGLTGATPADADIEAENGENIRGVKITPLTNTGGVKTPPLANTGGVKTPPPSTSSSKYINTTTSNTATADTDIEMNEDVLAVSWQEKRSLFVWLEKIPTDERQAFWDEFTGIVVNKARTASPIRDKVSYFRGMVNKHLIGEFNYTSASDQMAERRRNKAIQDATEQAALERLNRMAEATARENASPLSRKIAGMMEKKTGPPGGSG